MTAGIWTDEVRVRSYEVTPQGTASVLALADYFQEAAGRHADDLGLSMQDLLATGRAWVLAHFRLEIDRLPRWNEELTIETWPSGLERLFATREVIFRDGEGEALAQGTSAWLVIDTERRRPARPPAALHDLETPDRPAPLDAPVADDLPAPASADRERTVDVRYHDLDLNRHVNNVRYLEWALETLPVEILDERQCAALALQFEAEATLGDPVRAIAQIDDEDGPLQARHRLVQAEDNRTLALATTAWSARSSS